MAVFVCRGGTYPREARRLHLVGHVDRQGGTTYARARSYGKAFGHFVRWLCFATYARARSYVWSIRQFFA